MQLEDEAVLNLGCHVGVVFLGTVHGELLQIVGLELDAVELVVAAQLLYLGFGIGLRKHHIALFVASKLIEEVLFGVFLTVALLGTEILGNLEVGHDGGMVDGVELHLIAYLHRVGQCLGNVPEDFVHLGRRLHPLLLGVEHTGGVVEVLARGEADEAVVSLGMLFVYEVHVVGAHQTDAIFLAVFDKLLVHLQLQFVRLVVGTRYGSFVQLQFQIVVFTENALVPLYGFFGIGEHASGNLFGNLATQTSRTYDESLLVLLQLHAVGTGAVVETLGPRF